MRPGYSLSSSSDLVHSNSCIMDSTVIRAQFSLEEIEFLTQGRPVATTPRSTASSLTFSLSGTNTVYALAVADTALFQPFLKEKQLDVDVVLTTLRKTRDILKDSRDARSWENHDLLAVRFLQLAAFFLFLFVLLILISAYSDSPPSIYIAAAVFSFLGLLIIFFLLLTGGNCKRLGKRLGRSGFILSQNKKKTILNYLAVANKEIEEKNVQWRLGKSGNFMQLQSF